MPSAQTVAADSETINQNLRRQLDEHQHHCSQCGVCVAECHFLTRYGDPLQQASDYDPDNPKLLARPFECNLCGLCAQVCPDGLDPADMFLEMRREAFARGLSDLPEHRGLRKYERTGNSKIYSWYALPKGCDTIFFPGCALVGSRADTTGKVFEHLQQIIPALGIVLDCCNKPSHDLGDDGHFAAMFEEMHHYLTTHGIKQVLVACPNCSRVFNQYAPELTIRTIYEVLAEHPPAHPATMETLVTVHDPCVTRSDTRAQDAVRQLLSKAGARTEEMPHSKKRTICCGEGGGASCLVPEQAQQWIDQRLEEAQGKPIISYCAGCTNSFSNRTTTGHILDLIFEPQTALTTQHKVTQAPFTYLKRLQFKKSLQRHFSAATTRERTFVPPTAGKSRSIMGKLAIVALLIVAVIVAYQTGIAQYLEQERLRDLLQEYGMLAPLIYMAIYTLTPVLFLPGLPITIVGGILFGPLWGVVYSITSATAGACLAFLVSRYLARDLVKSRLSGARWRQLDMQVAAQGWKMVALTRLIPLFPFNLLNYAFGLTGIKLSHYALATFVFMLPGCIAFIVFSSSLLDLFQGNISPTFLFGLLLIAIVSLIPVMYPKIRRRSPSSEKTSQPINPKA
ncbi:MAG TPA: VTT domain-containing protein [Pelovirga sp.]|nr:VTT domain-containing protein [Pelovirga sp.]